MLKNKLSKVVAPLYNENQFRVALYYRSLIRVTITKLTESFVFVFKVLPPQVLSEEFHIRQQAIIPHLL